MNYTPDQNENLGRFEVNMIGIDILHSQADDPTGKGKIKDSPKMRGPTIICYCPPQEYPCSAKYIADWTRDIMIDPKWKYPSVGSNTDPLLPVLPILWYTLYLWWDILQFLFKNVYDLEQILLQSPCVEDTQQLNQIPLDLQSYILILNDYKDIIQYLLGIAKAQSSTIDPLQHFNVLAPPTPTQMTFKPSVSIASAPCSHGSIPAHASSQGPDAAQFWKSSSPLPSYHPECLDPNQLHERKRPISFNLYCKPSLAATVRASLNLVNWLGIGSFHSARLYRINIWISVTSSLRALLYRSCLTGGQDHQGSRGP
ncbi:hypothetical protein GYMLUDRAFT_64551 [Collybiopsis luxurians FD-317 M1]|uniref:Uncharacterized protein n=1 Tax=Collybiopsis luxurians FD-317 M1 TaxID=944289 RepID=A0A0D0BQQ2_9AGAR|nr:hypothetical protein GYMLUDRAFT_64551 [Collybiopsis luxurians FD-317 M1]